MKHPKPLLTIATALVSLFVAAWLLPKSTQLKSPLAAVKQILGFRSLLYPNDKIVYGFLPYWNYSKTDRFDWDQLTHLALFGIGFDGSGNLIKTVDGQTHPGWRAISSPATTDLIKKAKQNRIKPILTLVVFETATIEAILTNPKAQEKLIEQTIALIKDKGFEGVNIDFEYAGDRGVTLRQPYVKFVDQLNQAVKKVNPNHHVSLDVFAESTSDSSFWDVASLGPVVDHIIIMAYDFHTRGSNTAGPVAPLFGASLGYFSSDITTSLSKHFKLNQPEKLILGVPFYGYDWATESTSVRSSTLPESGKTATREKTVEMLKNNISANWDPVSLTPWLSYQDEGQTRQVYYEDANSLKLKYDLVNQADMAGIAIWALGYEAENDPLWNDIKIKLR